MGVVGNTDLAYRHAYAFATGDGNLDLPKFVQDLLRVMSFS